MYQMKEQDKTPEKENLLSFMPKDMKNYLLIKKKKLALT